jgi:hypothetical protein
MSINYLSPSGNPYEAQSILVNNINIVGQTINPTFTITSTPFTVTETPSTNVFYLTDVSAKAVVLPTASLTYSGSTMTFSDTSGATTGTTFTVNGGGNIVFSGSVPATSYVLTNGTAGAVTTAEFKCIPIGSGYNWYLLYVN